MAPRALQRGRPAPRRRAGAYGQLFYVILAASPLPALARDGLPPLQLNTNIQPLFSHVPMLIHPGPDEQGAVASWTLPSARSETWFLPTDTSTKSKSLKLNTRRDIDAISKPPDMSISQTSDWDCVSSDQITRVPIWLYSDYVDAKDIYLENVKVVTNDDEKLPVIYTGVKHFLYKQITSENPWHDLVETLQLQNLLFSQEPGCEKGRPDFRCTGMASEPTTFYHLSGAMPVSGFVVVFPNDTLPLHPKNSKKTLPRLRRIISTSQISEAMRKLGAYSYGIVRGESMKEAAVPEPKYRNWPYLKRLFNWHAPFWKTLVSLLSQDTSAGPPAWPSKYKNVQQSLTVGLLYPINGYVDFGIASSELVNWKPALYTYLYLALNHRLVFKESPDYDARARLPGLLAIYQPPVDPRLKSPPRPSYEYHLGELARNFEIFRGEDAGLPMAVCQSFLRFIEQLELHAGLLVTRELSHGAFGDLFLKARAACSQSVISEESMQHLVALRVILWEKHRKARAPVENPPQDVDDFERESGEFDSPISDRDPASPDVEWLAPGGLSAPETGRVLPMLHDGSS